MIKVEVSKKNIVISGHAMFDDYGKDIVCASASSIVITSINGILRLNDKSLKYEISKDKLSIEIINETDEVRKLILNMIDLLKELEKQYKKNIQVIEEV